MTYRDARDEISRFTSSPSHQTIWRYVQELGKEVNEFKANVYFSTDTTKFSRKSKVELVIVEGENVVVRANRSYEEIGEELNLHSLIALGDADKRLSIFEERQIDLIHVFREVNYKLWQHGVDLKTRKQYANEVKGILLSLKNSLDKPDLGERIEKTEKKVNEFVEEMDGKGFWRVARFFERHMKSILLFAYKRLEGINIPWHNNKMERKMGEIAKRMKNKWMSWSAKGAENLAGLLMKKYEREFYEMFLVRVMKLDRNIKWEVNFNP